MTQLIIILLKVISVLGKIQSTKIRYFHIAFCQIISMNTFICKYPNIQTKYPQHAISQLGVFILKFLIYVTWDTSQFS